MKTNFIIFPKTMIYPMVYSLELFETFMYFIYSFLPIIILDTYFIFFTRTQKDPKDTNYVDFIVTCY